MGNNKRKIDSRSPQQGESPDSKAYKPSQGTSPPEQQQYAKKQGQVLSANTTKVKSPESLNDKGKKMFPPNETLIITSRAKQFLLTLNSLHYLLITMIERSHVLPSTPSTSAERNHVLPSTPAERSHILLFTPPTYTERSHVLPSTPSTSTERSHVLTSTPSIYAKRSRVLHTTPYLDRITHTRAGSMPSASAERSLAEILKSTSTEISLTTTTNSEQTFSNTTAINIPGIKFSWIFGTKFSHKDLILAMDKSSEKPVHSPPSPLPLRLSSSSSTTALEFCAISISNSSQ
ncbi:unnamed protein product [Mytilus coruscus]|uniref:Uncharacterized protein n=1 Tax=Mytilus coruscus TaxID=42192 RepID=A0A6J8AIR6_MYTCO|nr:unnamed protein product [Mytilus coruscus]